MYVWLTSIAHTQCQLYIRVTITLICVFLSRCKLSADTAPSRFKVPINIEKIPYQDHGSDVCVCACVCV